MKLLVRLRRLAVAINPERRVRIRSPGSRCPAVAKENYYVNGTQTTGGKKGTDAHRSASKRKARGSQCQQGEGHRRRSKLTITNPDAAGIDFGAQVHYVAVPEDRTEVAVRSFGAYTAHLDGLVQWLKDCAIKTVAMESIGWRRGATRKRSSHGWD